MTLNDSFLASQNATTLSETSKQKYKSDGNDVSQSVYNYYDSTGHRQKNLHQNFLDKSLSLPYPVQCTVTVFPLDGFVPFPCFRTVLVKPMMLAIDRVFL
jgi:hypothetical protein